jgi:hypothetical protein
VLAGAVPLERLESIARRNAKVIQPAGDLQLPKLAARDGLNVRESRDARSVHKRLGIRIPKRHDHVLNPARRSEPLGGASIASEA